MRIIGVVAICIALGGCFAASKQEVAARLGQEYVGQNVDALVVRFGPPASTFRMNSGQTSYVWQLSAEANIAVSSDRYGSSWSARTNYCKVSVIASPTGIVQQLDTEDANAGYGVPGALRIYGSLCGQRLGMRPS